MPQIGWVISNGYGRTIGTLFTDDPTDADDVLDQWREQHGYYPWDEQQCRGGFPTVNLIGDNT